MPFLKKINAIIKPFIFYFILSYCFVTAYAQTEYLAKIDPATGFYTKIDSIPGVMYIYLFNYSNFDEKHHAYIFEGTKDLIDIYLYSVDANSGKIISKATVPAFNDHSTLQLFIYAASLNTMYGFYKENLTGKVYITAIDVASCSYSIIKEVPGLAFANYVTYDSVHEQLYFIGADVTGNYSLYNADAKTGNIIHAMTVGNVTDIQYNNNLQKLYGLVSTPGVGWNLDSFDIAAGKSFVIGSLPADFVGLLQGEATFDEIDNNYIFSGSDKSGGTFLYSINANTSNVIYKALTFRTNNIDSDNIIQYRFDNASGNLYALHWEAHTYKDTGTGNSTTGPPIIIFPNPLTGNGRVILDTVYSDVTFILYDALGRLVKIEKGSNTSYIDFSKGNLAAAVYFYRIVCNQRIRAKGKLIIE